MQHPKRYITFWEVRLPDGSRASCELRLTPIGSSSTSRDSFWTQVLNNLEGYVQIILKESDVDSSPNSPPKERER